MTLRPAERHMLERIAATGPQPFNYMARRWAVVGMIAGLLIALVVVRWL